MRVAYLDCYSGICGNMALAAVIDAGVSPRWIKEMVSRVVPDFRLQVSRQTRQGLAGVHARVDYPKKGQPPRRLRDIGKLIRKSGLSPAVQEKSLAVFQRLAEAEAKVHRRQPDQVHFHEVGAVDAMVDVVGTVAGLDRLGIRDLFCSPLPLAGGEVQCAHGLLPLPAPAVLELVVGVPVKGVPGEAELVTPTGAALAVTLATSFGPLPAMRIERTGIGLGDRDLSPRPNLLRLMIGERLSAGEELIQFEAAIDDMPGEYFGYLMDKLLEAGALEVLLVPAQMKKNRPGTLVRVLGRAEQRQALLSTFFAHSTTLGVREYEVSRAVLPRESLWVETEYGKIRVKVAGRPDGTRRYHPEYDDLKRAAQKSGVGLSRVAGAALEVLQKRKNRKT